MIILDTDHLSLLQRRGVAGARLLTRLEAANQPVAITIISVEEMIRGWMAEINRTPTAEAQTLYYAKLAQLLDYFAEWDVVAFDLPTAQQFEQLRRLHLRSIGTQDLKIAAVALRHKATLLSANLQHFRLVPHLQVEDWLHNQ